MRAAPKPHLALLALSTAAGLLLAAAGPSVAATAPAPATKPAASVTVPAGLGSPAQTATSLKLAWAPVTGAPRYRVQLSSSPSMTASTYYRVTGAAAEISGLKSGTTYYAKVRVIGVLGEPLSAYSPAVSVRTAMDPAATVSVPTGVKAGPEGNSAVSAQWPEVANAPAYRLRISDRPDMGAPTEVLTAEPSAKITGLLAATTYYVQVQAVTAAGAPLTGFSSTVRTGTSWSAAPSGLAAKTSQSAASLSWNAVPQAASYRVAYSLTADMAGATWRKFTTTSGTISGLKASTGYFIKVRALKADGTSLTGYSPAVPAQTAAVPLAPGSFKTTSSSRTSLGLSWTAVPDAVSYGISYSNSADMSSAGYKKFTGTSALLGALKSGTPYWLQIRGLDASGNALTDYSQVISGRTEAPLAAPAALTAASIGNDRAALTWKPVEGAAEYRLAYSLTPDMAGATWRDSTTTGRTIYLAQGTTYFVKVRALDSAGKGITDYSPAITLKTTSVTPPPAGLAASGTDHDSSNLTWKPVPGAGEYRVVYSLKPDMSDPTYRDSNITSRTIYLAPASTYYVQVRALDSAGKGITAYSSSVQLTTKAALPAPPAALKTVRATPTTLDLAWGPVPGTVQYRVELTKDGDSAPSYIRFPGTTANIRGLNPATGYSVRVRSLDATGATITGYSPALATKTPAVPVLAPVEHPLSVASFNIHCSNCMDPVPGEAPWADRRDSVVADVVDRMPEVIGFQEASQAWLKDVDRPGGYTQFEDLRDRLNAAGGNYELTNTKRNNCENPLTPTGCVPTDQGASQGTRIFYDRTKIELLRNGSKRLPELEEATNDRYVAWAEVKQISSGKRFFIANTHLEATKGEGFNDLRARQAQLVMDTIASQNTAKLPVILVGDMNSSKWLAPSNSAYDVITGAGLIDPLGNTYRSRYASGDATAETVINRAASSWNGYSREGAAGTPGQSGSYIDYIFTSKMRVQLYENVGEYDSNGNRVGVFGSDHNMQFAIVGLP